MNNLIMSGSGKDANFIGEWAGAAVIFIVVIIISFPIATALGYTDDWRGELVRDGNYYNVLYGIWVVVFLLLCFVVYIFSKFRKTKLDVYETGIEGIALNSSETNPLTEAVPFKLDYDKIISIVATKKKLTIFAYGKIHVIFLYAPHLFAIEVNNRIKTASQGINVTAEASLEEKKAMFCANCGQGFDDNTIAFCPGCGAKR